MTQLIFENVTVKYPIYNTRSTSLRNQIIRISTGGVLAKEAGQIQVVTALENVSFKLNHGDAVGLIGHNGAGKSTLLRTMAGIYNPIAGNITRTGKIASVLEIGAGLDPDLSGYENITRMSILMGLSIEDARRNITEIEDFTQLGNFLDLPMRTYSTGMATRLMFAVATSIRPDILLIDEIFSTGDSDFQLKAKKRLEDFLGSVGILVFASHDMLQIERYCTRFFSLEHGELREIARSDIPRDGNKFSKAASNTESEIAKSSKSYRRQEKFIVVRPEGGLGDIFNQIWLGYLYAIKQSRTLIIDSDNTGFGEDFFKYFHPIVANIKSVDALTTASKLTFFPGSIGKMSFGYRAEYSQGLDCFVSVHNPGECLSLDWDSEYPHDVVLHHGCGGGTNGGKAFCLFRLSANLRNEFLRRKFSLPRNFCGLHIRDTDLKSDWFHYINEHFEELSSYKAIFLCSDNQNTLKQIIEKFSSTLVFAIFSKNISTNNYPIHESKNVDRAKVNFDAISDLLLLASSEKIFSSKILNGYGTSGFARLATELKAARYVDIMMKENDRV